MVSHVLALQSGPHISTHYFAWRTTPGFGMYTPYPWLWRQNEHRTNVIFCLISSILGSWSTFIPIRTLSYFYYVPINTKKIYYLKRLIKLEQIYQKD